MAENRYKNAKIYRLVNKVDDEIYVGSTCSPLSKRLYEHKHMAKIKPNRKVYQHLNNIGWENVNVILIEEYPCENKMQLERKERQYIETLKASLNGYIPTRRKQEWYIENAEKEHEKQAKYRAENADKICEYQAKYHKENAEKISERKAKYRLEHRDAVNAKQRERYALKKQQ
jgi:hypothetical protein